MIIKRPKNLIFKRFGSLSKFHFPACSTLAMSSYIRYKLDMFILYVKEDW